MLASIVLPFQGSSFMINLALSGEAQMSGLEKTRERLEAELKRWVDLLVAHYRPQQILLFGSLAQGQIREDSDVDLIVICETQQDFWERLITAYRLLQPRVPVDLLIYTPMEWKELQQRLFFCFRRIWIAKGGPHPAKILRENHP